MALVVKDRVKQTTTTTGTGSLVLNGTVDSFQTFTSALTNADTTYYALVEPSTNEWEVGLGTWTESTTTLARTTILESSNSGSAINLTAGEAEVFITQPAEKAVYYDANGDITPTGNVDVAGTLDVTGAATFDDSVTIQGDLTINGTTTTVSATNLAIEDNMIYLNDGSTTTNPDLGWAGNYNDGTYAHAGVFRDASDGTFKIYDGYTPEPGAAIDTTHASFTLAPLDTGALSVEGNVTVTGTVDGRDVASDGSKLDGIEAGATGDQSASEILTAVKTVDGSGSGLDADLLDGQQGSYYLDWTHVTNKPDPSVTLSGDVSGSATMTNLGSINITTTVANDSHTHDGRYYTESEIGNFFLGTTAITGYNKSNWDTAFGWGNHASANYLVASSYTAADVLTKIKTVDGSGSGLDADLLDGQSSAYYLDWTNTTNKPDPTLTLNGDVSGSATFTNLGNATLTVAVANDSHTHDGRYYTETEADNRFVQEGGTTFGGTYPLVVRTAQNDIYSHPNITFTGSTQTLSVGGNITINGNTAFHDGYHPNADKWTTARSLSLSGDASGSVSWDGSANATLTVTVADDSHNHIISNVDGLQTALDGKLSTSGKAADSNLLDGIDSSAFLRSDANDSYSGILTGGELAQGQHPVHTGYYGIWNTQAYGVDSQNYMIINAGNDTFITGNDAVYIRGADNSPVNEVVVTTSGTTIGGNTVWHAGNDGAGSGLDADLWDGNQFSSYLNQAVLTSSSPSFAGVNINGNLNAVDNIYLAGALYHEGDTNTGLTFGTDTITLSTGGSSEVIVTTTGVRLGDSGNGYFQPVTGNYGSIQIDGGAHGAYEGYSIGGRAVFMHNNGSTMGLYDDVNNEWAFIYTFNGAAELYNNGSSKLQTTSSGVNITGSLTINGSELSGGLDDTTASTSTTSQTAIATYSATTYGSAKLLVTAKRGTDRQMSELLIVHNGTTASATEYGVIATGSTLANFDVDISGGNIRLLATATSATTTSYTITEILVGA